MSKKQNNRATNVKEETRPCHCPEKTEEKDTKKSR